jgi:hypothetical protein
MADIPPDLPHLTDTMLSLAASDAAQFLTAVQPVVGITIQAFSPTDPDLSFDLTVRKLVYRDEADQPVQRFFWQVDRWAREAGEEWEVEEGWLVALEPYTTAEAAFVAAIQAAMPGTSDDVAAEPG